MNEPRKKTIPSVFAEQVLMGSSGHGAPSRYPGAGLHLRGARRKDAASIGRGKLAGRTVLVRFWIRWESCTRLAGYLSTSHEPPQFPSVVQVCRMQHVADVKLYG